MFSIKREYYEKEKNIEIFRVREFNWNCQFHFIIFQTNKTIVLKMKQLYT